MQISKTMHVSVDFFQCFFNAKSEKHFLVFFMSKCVLTGCLSFIKDQINRVLLVILVLLLSYLHF